MKTSKKLFRAGRGLLGWIALSGIICSGQEAGSLRITVARKQLQVDYQLPGSAILWNSVPAATVNTTYTNSTTSPIIITPAPGFVGFLTNQGLAIDTGVRYQKLIMQDSLLRVSDSAILPESTNTFTFLASGQWENTWAYLFPPYSTATSVIPSFSAVMEGYPRIGEAMMLAVPISETKIVHYVWASGTIGAGFFPDDTAGEPPYYVESIIDLTLSNPIDPVTTGGNPSTYSYSASGIPTINRSGSNFTSARYQITVPAGAAGTLRWMEVFNPAADPNTKQYVAKEWTIDGTQSPEFTLTTPADGSSTLVPYEVQLSVDANRDGQIKLPGEDSSDQTSAAVPFRFWLNDDDDTTNGSPQWSDLDPEFYPPRRPDSTDRVINSPRDCEDLARLWVNLNGLSQMLQATGGNLAVGLKWKNFTIPNGSSSTGPCIRLFRSADTAGGLGHIKDAMIAAIQADRSFVTSPGFCLLDADAPDVPVIAPDAVDKVQPTERLADFIFKTRDLSLNQGSPTTHLLFEGVSEGKGELEIVILHNKNADSSQPGNWELVGEGPSVWLQLDNIRRMYLRVHSTPVDDGFPFPWAQTSPPAEPYYEDTSTTGKPITILPSKLGFASGDTGSDDGNYSFVPSPDEQAKCVVFVHGIDMTVDDQRGYSQSFFKRLWWEGYRGRFVAFRWNTPLSSLANVFGITDTNPNISIFNSGEYRSWKAGTSLNKFANALRDSTSSFYFKPNAVIGLVAHSLGNACATEALNQGAPFDSYIAMEAAIPLSCFYTSSLFGDPQPPTVARLLDAETQKPTPQYLVDGGYQGYLYDSPGLAAPRKVSYNNQNDFWLDTGTLSTGTEVNWIKNEASYKPDDRYGPGQYAYNPPYLPYFMRGTSFSRSVTDPHESMSFASRSRTRALGAGVPGGSFGSTSSSSVNLAFSYQFAAARFDHSGQFQRNIQLMYGDESGTQWRDSSTGQVLSLYRRLMRDLQIDQ